MQNIRKDFTDKYLAVHHRYLDSIWALTIPNQDITVPQDVISKFKNTGKNDREKSLQNLRNSWYHECAFLCQYDNQDEWIKFASWKIIQFYYSIYCMLSAMIRCIDDLPEINHKKMLNKFTTEFITNSKLNKTLFTPPFCFYMKNNNIYPDPQNRILRPFALENDFPTLKLCLHYTSSNSNSQKLVSIFHYFKCLREWATYENSYILMSLYGPVVKEKLGRYLYSILNRFLTIGEVFLIMFWNYDSIKAEFNQFRITMTTINLFQPKSLETRFNIYDTSNF